MSRVMLSSQQKLIATCPRCSHRLGLDLQVDGGTLSPGRCFSPPLAGRLGSDGDQPWSGSKAWLKALPGLSACTSPRRIYFALSAGQRLAWWASGRLHELGFTPLCLLEGTNGP